MLVAAIVSAFSLAACARATTAVTKNEPSHVEKIEGTELNRVTLTEKAVQRLALKTDPVAEAEVARAGTSAMRKLIPYGAVIYDLKGATWAYTNPEPLTYIRHAIQVEYIEGDTAVLSDGPPAGTPVVSVGAAALYGVEFGVGK
jgi:hypothetical protein